MNRILLGGLLALFFAGIGLFWIQGRAEVERAAPPPAPARQGPDPMELPSLSPDALDGMVGPELPEATALTREERRFSGYDRNSDGRVTRTEMLSRRTPAFRALDKDGNNLLTFEEWAATSVNKFDKADADGNDWLTPVEFRSTAPPARKQPPSKCSCK